LQKQVILPGARIKEGKYAAINIHIGESFFWYMRWTGPPQHLF
jgi:hypothetical protein